VTDNAEHAPTGNLLELRGLSKSFDGSRALNNVTFSVAPGEIRGLVGQNGAGKSTLVKILSGYYAPDEGTMWLRGERVKMPLPNWEARRRGLGFFHQNLALVPELTILENLRVGRYETAAGMRVPWKAERAEARRLLRALNLDVDPDLTLRRLPQAERALIGFARALQDVEACGTGLLVLDEPSAYLPGPAVRTMYDATRALVDKGSSVVLVSHRMEEVLGFTDRISVLRDGEMVGTIDREDATEEEIVRMLLGRDLGSMYPPRSTASGTELLEVSGLSGAICKDVSFHVRKGEILGLTGLVGMGHDEVPYLLYGARKASAGSIVIDGEEAAASDQSPATARESGFALLPADRQGESGILSASVIENATMPVVSNFYRHGVFHHREERAHVDGLIQKFLVRANDPSGPLALLSGGNQQKVLLGKWLQLNPKVQLLHEPTHGVDIGSKKHLFDLIKGIVEAGLAVVVASAEHEELANICHRVLIFSDGQITAELSGADLTQDRIVELCYTARPAQSTADSVYTSDAKGSNA
jgi:ribose transport system ATP-binding protein